MYFVFVILPSWEHSFLILSSMNVIDESYRTSLARFNVDNGLERS